MKMDTYIKAVSFLLLFSGSAFTEPALSILGNTYNFGTVPQNTTVAQYFWFKSTGSDTLRILNVKTGCDCATMPLEKNWISPGDSMLVGLHWKTDRRVASIVRYPYIFTNAKKEAYRIYLNAQVSQSPDSTFPMSVTPYILSLAKTSVKTIDSIEFHLMNHLDKDLTIQLVSHLPEQVTLQLPTEIKAKGKAVGYIVIKREFAEKEFSESFTLMTDDNRESRITIPVIRKIYTTASGTK